MAGTARTRQEQREFAATMRSLPGRYADRLSRGALERITGAAAAGRWQEAVEELIIALHARAESVTDAEHAELCAVGGLEHAARASDQLALCGAEASHFPVASRRSPDSPSPAVRS
jgi:histone H3/H4